LASQKVWIFSFHFLTSFFHSDSLSSFVFIFICTNEVKRSEDNEDYWRQVKTFEDKRYLLLARPLHTRSAQLNHLSYSAMAGVGAPNFSVKRYHLIFGAPTYPARISLLQNNAPHLESSLQKHTDLLHCKTNIAKVHSTINQTHHYNGRKYWSAWLFRLYLSWVCCHCQQSSRPPSIVPHSVYISRLEPSRQ
jgi:hypothetical protein